MLVRRLSVMESTDWGGRKRNDDDDANDNHYGDCGICKALNLVDSLQARENNAAYIKCIQTKSERQP